MKTIPCERAARDLAGTLDEVARDREPVVITRAKHPSAVIMSLDDFQSLEETAYLLRSPRNARRLMSAMDQLESGRGRKRKLAE